MTTQAEHTLQVSREIAAHDLSDIKKLRQDEAFNRYYVRRLKARAEAIGVRFETASSDEVDHAEREILRRLLAEYKSILRMLDEDERSAQEQLDRTKPQDPTLAGTAGMS